MGPPVSCPFLMIESVLKRRVSKSFGMTVLSCLFSDRFRLCRVRCPVVRGLHGARREIGQCNASARAPGECLARTSLPGTKNRLTRAARIPATCRTVPAPSLHHRAGRRRNTWPGSGWVRRGCAPFDRGYQGPGVKRNGQEAYPGPGSPRACRSQQAWHGQAGNESIHGAFSDCRRTAWANRAPAGPSDSDPRRSGRPLHGVHPWRPISLFPGRKSTYFR